MPRQSPSETTLLAGVASLMASSAAPVNALLDMAVSCAAVATGRDSVGAAVFKLDLESRSSWTLLARTAGFDPDQALTSDLMQLLAASRHMLAPGDDTGWGTPQPIQDGTGSAIRLYGLGELLGVLVLDGCPPDSWSTVPYSVSAALTMALTGGVVVQHTVRAETAFVHRSARAIRRLFEEGSHAGDIEEAGTVLARVAAEAFETERAGIYVVDADGLISFAVSVGVSPDLSDALADSLVGKRAADSPSWLELERAGGPVLIDDASTVPLRPGGFVETLGCVSFAAIPLLSKSGPLGIVVCGDVSSRRTWTAQERELAAHVALEGALIVDAARLRASERAQLAHISHQAFHDGLTGVPNRTMLMDRLECALSAASERQTQVAMLVLDLDDFKRVNDTLGHRYGDELLREVAHRLTMSLRGSDTVARLGGDEFAILISEDACLAKAHSVAARVESLLSVPVDLDGISLNAVASIGIAVFPDHARTSADLLQRADIAMYAAKRSDNGPVVYQPSQDHATVDKLRLYTELRGGIGEGQLALVYQPKLDLHTNAITGVETLVRWKHPRRGLLSPCDFLPMAESTGLIHSLTAWVLRNALHQWALWRAAGITLDLAVNVSARDLLDRTLMERIGDLARGTGVAPHLVIEVTETAVMVDPKESARALAAIRTLGVRISMDDFGTGNSSLALLGQLPVDELKIDRLLVHHVASGDINDALVEAVISVGHRLGLAVVAEGIETARTLQAVRKLGCDLGQGYFISHPVSADEIVGLLQVPRLALASVSRERARDRLTASAPTD